MISNHVWGMLITIIILMTTGNAMAGLMEGPVGELKSGNCNTLPGYSQVVDKYGGAVGCAGGSVFKSGPQITVDFHYEGSNVAGYYDTNAFPPEANGLDTDAYNGYGRVDFSPDQIDLTIKSQVALTIPNSIDFGDFGADGGFKFVGMVDDPTLADGEPITLQMSVNYDVTANCDVSLICGLGSSFQLVEKPLDPGGGSTVIFDSKNLGIGPNGGDFFPSSNFIQYVNCVFNSSAQQNECDVNTDETQFIQLNNRVPYGILIIAYVFGGGPEGNSFNVDNSDTWSMTVTLTEANPNATFILIPEPAAFAIVSISALAVFRRNRKY